MKADYAIIPIMGFTQARETETGFERMWDRVLRKYSDPDKCTVYQPETWKMNVKRRLEQLRRLGIKHIFLVAYSHGQAAAMEIAEKSWEYGIETVDMALLDPVGRNPMLPRWTWAQGLSARSMSPWMSIKIPDTVSRVVWARQYNNLPRAHDLKWDSSYTYVQPALVLNCTHSSIQWHPDWFNLVDNEVNRWLNPPRAIPVSLKQHQ
jgi:pimeloyl-ACP methyl ester carboxylesterase